MIKNLYALFFLDICWSCVQFLQFIENIRSNKMLLRGCLHTHSTYSDGKLTPQQVADSYERLGYDFIAFTDHDYLLKSNYREAIEAVKSDMIIFYGVELTVFVKGYIHVNHIEGDEEELYIFNHIGEYDITPAQAADRLRELEKKFPIGAVEITSKGFREREFEDYIIGYPKIASDDSHDRVNIGRAWIEMDTDRNKDAILKAVKENRFWNCYV